MKHRIAILTVISLLFAKASFAAIITFEYAGIVDSLYKATNGSGSYVSSAEINGLTFSTSQHFAGSFSYNSSATPSQSDTPDDGLQVFSGGVLNYTFFIVESGYTFFASAGNVALSPGLVPPIFTTDSISFFAPISLFPYINSMVYLSNPIDDTVFSDYSLPDFVPLDNLPYRSFYFEYYNSPTEEFLSFRSSIDSFRIVAPVSEPSTLFLLMLGLCVLVWRKRLGISLCVKRNFCHIITT